MLLWWKGEITPTGRWTSALTLIYPFEWLLCITKAWGWGSIFCRRLLYSAFFVLFFQLSAGKWQVWGMLLQSENFWKTGASYSKQRVKQHGILHRHNVNIEENVLQASRKQCVLSKREAVKNQTKDITREGAVKAPVHFAEAKSAGCGLFHLLQTDKCWKWVAFWCVRLKGFSFSSGRSWGLSGRGRGNSSTSLSPSLSSCRPVGLIASIRTISPTWQSLNLNVRFPTWCRLLLECMSVHGVFWKVK